MQVRRNLNGPYPRGVVNPYTTHAHPYPTRFHGGIYTRPVFGLPYVRSPHAVFKPDDFYEYYGVKGLGSVGVFNGSSMGNNLLGGNTLGLGATGAPIYYLASSSNPKVVSLQGGLNKVLVAQGYREIPVTGKLDYKTCAALGLMGGKFPSEVRSQIDGEILEEAARTCRLAQQNSTVKNQTIKYAQELEDNKNPTPAQVLEPQTEVVPPTTAPAVKPPAPAPAPQPTTPPVSKPVPVKIEEAAAPIEFPEIEVTARPPDKSYGSTNWMLIGGLLLAGGAGYYFLKKKR